MTATALGILLNAHAGRARRHPEMVGHLERLLPTGRVRTTSKSEEIGPALSELQRAGVDTLMLVGGDGTIGGTLTRLFERWPSDRLPAIVPTRGGTVNTIARSLGARGTPEDSVSRLLANRPPRNESCRAVVQASADEGPAHHGLILVNGVGVRFLELYYATGLGARGAASVVARLAGSAIVRGPLARRIFSSFRAEIRVDGEPLEQQQFTVTGAAGVKHVGLGFQPFLTAGDDPTRLHFTATDATARQILREMPAFLRGRAIAGTRFIHRSARRIEIRTEVPEPWSLDADVLPPARRLEIVAGPTLRFLCP